MYTIVRKQLTEKQYLAVKKVISDFSEKCSMSQEPENCSINWYAESSRLHDQRMILIADVQYNEYGEWGYPSPKRFAVVVDNSGNIYSFDEYYAIESVQHASKIRASLVFINLKLD